MCVPSAVTRTMNGLGVFLYVIVILAAVGALVALVMKRRRMYCFEPEPTDPPYVG